jgi:hypothetical protein
MQRVPICNMLLPLKRDPTKMSDIWFYASTPHPGHQCDNPHTASLEMSVYDMYCLR